MKLSYKIIGLTTMIYTRTIAKYIGVFLLVAILFSCEKQSGPSGEPIDPKATIVSFKNDVQPIFNENCISCHPSSGDMSLKEEDSFENLVNYMSPTYNVVRVSPFHADSSVICMKLHGVEGYGFLMPLNGIPYQYFVYLLHW